MPYQIRGGDRGGASGLNELLRIVEYRGIARTVAYLNEWDAMDAKHRTPLKMTPMVRLVRDLQGMVRDRIKADGIRRKREAASG